VATVTIACGADNIGVYIPLFAACNSQAAIDRRPLNAPTLTTGD
jgi:hypothetical protein